MTQSQLRPTLAGAPVKRVRYEDVCRDPVRAVRNIMRFATGAGPAQSLDLASIDPRRSHICGGNHMRHRPGPIEVRLDDAWRRELCLRVSAAALRS